MPGFPTHIVVTPTNRVKARRYTSLCRNFKTDSSAAKAVKKKRRVMPDLKVRPPGAIQTHARSRNRSASPTGVAVNGRPALQNQEAGPTERARHAAPLQWKNHRIPQSFCHQ